MTHVNHESSILRLRIDPEGVLHMSTTTPLSTFDQIMAEWRAMCDENRRLTQERDALAAKLENEEFSTHRITLTRLVNLAHDGWSIQIETVPDLGGRSTVVTIRKDSSSHSYQSHTLIMAVYGVYKAAGYPLTPEDA